MWYHAYSGGDDLPLSRRPAVRGSAVSFSPHWPQQHERQLQNRREQLTPQHNNQLMTRTVVGAIAQAVTLPMLAMDRATTVQTIDHPKRAMAAQTIVVAGTTIKQLNNNPPNNLQGLAWEMMAWIVIIIVVVILIVIIAIVIIVIIFIIIIVIIVIIVKYFYYYYSIITIIIIIVMIHYHIYYHYYYLLSLLLFIIIVIIIVIIIIIIIITIIIIILLIIIVQLHHNDLHLHTYPSIFQWFYRLNTIRIRKEYVG